MSETSSGSNADEQVDSSRTFVLEQGGETHEIAPLSHREQSIEEFYNYRGVRASADTPTNVEQGPQRSKLFLYEDPEGVSLVLVHDDHNYPGSTASGGDVVFTFSGLDGTWAIEDDPGDWTRWSSSPPERIHWQWNDRNTDGGVFRFDSDEFAVTVEPDFRSGITEWEVLSGDADDPERIGLQMDEAITLSSVTGSVSASATALHYINGENENFTQGGHPLRSSQMQLFRQDEIFEVDLADLVGVSMELPVDPVIDNWQKGDMLEHQPTDLGDALEQKSFKNEDEFLDIEFNEYRFMNRVQVSFETTDEGRKIDEETVRITFNERADVDDDAVEFAGRSESYTVLVDPDEEDVDDSADAELNNLLGHGWFETYDELRERGTRKPRYYTSEILETDGVEALRVATISGGYAGFSHEIADRGKQGPRFFNTIFDWGLSDPLLKIAWLALPLKARLLADVLPVVPNIYSFLDFLVLADGRRIVRVWDASTFPSVAVYLDGTCGAERLVDYQPRQRTVPRMTDFFQQATARQTPYHAPSPRLYLYYLRNDLLGRETGNPIPLRTVGLDADENPIEDVDDLVPGEIPDPLDVRVPFDPA